MSMTKSFIRNVLLAMCPKSGPPPREQVVTWHQLATVLTDPVHRGWKTAQRLHDLEERMRKLEEVNESGKP